MTALVASEVSSSQKKSIFSTIGSSYVRPFVATRHFFFGSVFDDADGRRHAETWLARPLDPPDRWWRPSVRTGFIWLDTSTFIALSSAPVAVFWIASTLGLMSVTGFSSTFVLWLSLVIAWSPIPWVLRRLRMLKSMKSGPIAYPRLPSDIFDRWGEAAMGSAENSKDRFAVFRLLCDAPERLMQMVKDELGMTDARALMLFLAFPNDPNAPRSGEASELLGRVTELVGGDEGEERRMRATRFSWRPESHGHLPGSLSL